jgi:iron complex transport system ATP-binding protein
VSEPTGHILEASDLRFAYPGGPEVLRGVSFSAPAGRLVAVLGPNGSGKTTLLRCCQNRLTPQAGEVRLDGRPVSRYGARPLARLMAYVPQFPRAAFQFSVEEIVLMGRYAHTGLLGLVSERDRAVAREAMKMTGSLERAHRTLDELSGGEAQCVMIARALAQQPQVCLLDEPTSHLDIRNQLRIYEMMRRLAHEWNMAVVCVSHDVNLAGRFADQMLLMSDGALLADGPPAEVLRRDVLEQTYGVEVELMGADDGGAPTVRALRRLQQPG